MELRLFVADDFRTLADGKTLAIGLFTDSVVIFNVPQDIFEQIPNGSPLAATISFLACITDVEPGPHKFNAAFHGPDGAPLPYQVQLQRPVGKNRIVNLIFNVQRFEVRAGGVYTLQVIVDDGEPLTGTFTLRVQPMTPATVRTLPGADSPSPPGAPLSLN